MSDTEIPEACRLVAHWTGEGWQLSVVDRDGNTVAYLQCDDDVRRSYLEFAGFEIV